MASINQRFRPHIPRLHQVIFLPFGSPEGRCGARRRHPGPRVRPGPGRRRGSENHPKKTIQEEFNS